MRQTQFKQVVILSGYLDILSEITNIERTARLVKVLESEGIVYNRAVGVYKDSVETSFVCLPKCNGELMFLMDLGLKVFSQESILVQNKQGDAVLMYQDWTTKRIGKLRQMDSRIARKQESYTLLNDQYYVAS